MLKLPGSLKAQISGNVRVLRFASCWRITRTDGVIIRVTDHNCALTVMDDSPNQNVFSPVTAFVPSARQLEASLKERNVELQGAISSDLITPDDLRAGRYRD